MLGSSKKEKIGRISPRIEKNKRQFYTYSSSNRYKVSKELPIKRDRLNNISLDTQVKDNSLEKITNYTIILLLIVCIGYSTTLSADSRLIVNKNKVVLSNRSSNEYDKTLNMLLNSSILNKNKITINTVKISKDLKSKYPEITKVEVRLPLIGRRPVVNITTDEIAIVIKANNKTYGVGRSGKLLIESNNQLEINKETPIIIDESGIENKIGSNILTTQDVDFILNLIKQFKIKNIAIDTIILPKLAAEVRVKPVGVSYIIKFNMLTDYKVTVGQYFSLKKKLDSEGIVPTEYIDSRIEERIYYK